MLIRFGTAKAEKSERQQGIIFFLSDSSGHETNAQIESNINA